MKSLVGQQQILKWTLYFFAAASSASGWLWPCVCFLLVAQPKLNRPLSKLRKLHSFLEDALLASWCIFANGDRKSVTIYWATITGYIPAGPFVSLPLQTGTVFGDLLDTVSHNVSLWVQKKPVIDHPDPSFPSTLR